VLTAAKPSTWRRRYDISVDGVHVSRWEPTWWQSGGVFELDGQQYHVRRSALGGRDQLTGPAGEPLASAQRVGRKRWTVQAGTRTYEFRRASIWRGDQELILGDQAVGSIRRDSVWRHSAVADLPGMPRSVQVFVFCVVLAMWDAAAVAASSA